MIHKFWLTNLVYLICCAWQSMEIFSSNRKMVLQAITWHTIRYVDDSSLWMIIPYIIDYSRLEWNKHSSVTCLRRLVSIWICILIGYLFGPIRIENHSSINVCYPSCFLRKGTWFLQFIFKLTNNSMAAWFHWWIFSKWYFDFDNPDKCKFDFIVIHINKLIKIEMNFRQKIEWDSLVTICFRCLDVPSV